MSNKDQLDQMKLSETQLNNLIIDLGETNSFVSVEDLRLFDKSIKFYIMLRSLTIEFHILIEYLIEDFISIYFVGIGENLDLPNSKRFQFKEMIIKTRFFTFEEKKNVLKKIYKSEDKNFYAKLETINDIRNGIAVLISRRPVHIVEWPSI